MSTQRFVYWQDGDHLLGYFEDFPDYWTQGESLEDLKAQLADLYRDLSHSHSDLRGWEEYFEDESLRLPDDFELPEDLPPQERASL